MGLACQINRDSTNGNIISVEAPNGEMSSLFNNLLNIVLEQDALNLWAYSYSPEFENLESSTRKDVNGEHFISTVLKRVKIDTTDSGIDNNDLLNISDSFSSIEDTDELQNILETSFYDSNGVFNPTKKSLKRHFTSNEITYILGDKDVQNNIKSLILKLRNSENQAVPSKRGLPTNEFTKFGKVKYRSTFDLNLIGVEDREEFDNIGMSLFGDLYTEELSNKLYNLYSNKQKLIVTDENGNIKYDDDILELFNSTLKTNIPNINLSSSIDTLLGIDVELFYEKEVEKIVNNIEEQAAKIGIDLSQLSNNMVENKSEEETKSFLRDLKDFTSLLFLDTAQDTDVNNFASKYAEYFNIERKPRYSITDKSDLSLLSIETEKNELDLFNDNSILKVNSEGIYQKINKEDATMDNFMQIVLDNKNILPKEAYYPTAFNSKNEFKPERVEDNNNIRLDILRWLNKTASKYYGTKDALQLVMAKVVFGHKLNTKEEDLTINTGFKGNVEYLTGEFLSDFNIEIAKEKQKNSLLYNKVLKHFGIDGKGIYIKTLNPDDIADITYLTPKNKSIYNNLREYTKISKRLDSKIKYTPITSDTQYISANTLKDIYINNPLILNEYKGDYEVSERGLIVLNNAEDFIRIGRDVYEKVEQTKNVSTYRYAGSQTSSLFNTMNNNVLVKESTYTGKHLNLLSNKNSSSNSYITTKTPKNKQIIEDSIDRCS